MEKTANLSKALTIRVTPREADMLRAEAKRRGCKSVGACVRELAVEGVQGQVTPSLILRVLLSFRHATLESLKEAAGETNWTPERMDEIRKNAEAISGDLLASFMYQESLKIKPQEESR